MVRGRDSQRQPEMAREMASTAMDPEEVAFVVVAEEMAMNQG